MSLTLRKKTQPILDGVNLANLHADIDNNRGLTLVNECGKTLLVVYGVKFSRLNPNNEEIGYAASLLDAFLAKHAANIHEALDLIAKATALAAQPLPYGDISHIHSTYFEVQLPHDASVRFDAEDMTIMNINEGVNMTLAQLSVAVRPLLDPKLEIRLKECLTQSKAAQAAQAAANEAMHKLTTCAI